MVPWLFNGGIRWIQYCSFNKENSDDKPSKLEVPYYQTNPHCLLGSLFEHPLSLSFFYPAWCVTLSICVGPGNDIVLSATLGSTTGRTSWSHAFGSGVREPDLAKPLQSDSLLISFEKQRILMILYGFCMDFLWVSRYPVVLHSSVRQVRMMSQNPRRALAACNVFAASQCLYQTGIELPVASSMACFFFNGHKCTEVDDESSSPFRSWLPFVAPRWLSVWRIIFQQFHGVPMKATGKEVLVLRARYWHRPSWAILHGCVGSISAAEWV